MDKSFTGGSNGGNNGISVGLDDGSSVIFNSVGLFDIAIDGALVIGALVTGTFVVGVLVGCDVTGGAVAIIGGSVKTLVGEGVVGITPD